MGLAIAEARRGLGRTFPNPPVGAVLVKAGRVVGAGFHRAAGQPHAEIEALANAGPERARGADLYVTLEPHAHQGRTPPCTDALIKAGVARVFIGSIDANPKVSGRGVTALESAGIPVVSGVRRVETEALARGFFSVVRTGRPFVTLKVATTLDGKLATQTGDSKWITGPAARAEVHRMRDEHDAILVGANTVNVDDPLLTTRLDAPVDGRAPRNPVRIVLSRGLGVEASKRVFDVSAGPVWVVCEDASGPVAEKLVSRGVKLVTCPAAGGAFVMAELLASLGSLGLTSVLVEGGAAVHRSFVTSKAWDELVAFVAPKVVGGDGRGWVAGFGLSSMADAPAFRLVTQDRVGDDARLVFAPA